LQESSFVHPPGETTPLAEESTAVNVCDFVLQEEDTKPSSKTVVDLQEEDTKPSSKTVIDLQSDSAKVAPLSKTVLDLKEKDTSDSNESDKEASESYWKNLIPQCNWRFIHCFLKLTPPNCCQHPSGCNNFTHVRCATLWLLEI
jgi:hypothetical protein